MCCGRMDKSIILLGAAHVHLPDHLRVAEQDGWSVQAVHDRDAARAARLARTLGAGLTQPDRLAGTGASAAIVCSETVHHEADCLAALHAGLDVFCEKPLGGSAFAAGRIADTAQGLGRVLQTGFFMRTLRPVQALKARLDAGAIGAVTEARVRFAHDGGYADWLDLDCWMTDPALACYDGFVDEAVHGIDLLRWLLGPVERGHAVTGRTLGWRVDDHGAAVLRHDSGAISVVEAGWTDSRMRLEIDLVGQNGGADLRDGAARIWRRGRAPEPLPGRAVLDAGDGLRPFLRALAGDPAPALVPPQDAAAVNTILDAMGLRLT